MHIDIDIDIDIDRSINQTESNPIQSAWKGKYDKMTKGQAGQDRTEAL